MSKSSGLLMVPKLPPLSGVTATAIYAASTTLKAAAATKTFVTAS